MTSMIHRVHLPKIFAASKGTSVHTTDINKFFTNFKVGKLDHSSNTAKMIDDIPLTDIKLKKVICFVLYVSSTNHNIFIFDCIQIYTSALWNMGLRISNNEAVVGVYPPPTHTVDTHAPTISMGEYGSSTNLRQSGTLGVSNKLISGDKEGSPVKWVHYLSNNEYVFQDKHAFVFLVTN